MTNIFCFTNWTDWSLPLLIRTKEAVDYRHYNRGHTVSRKWQIYWIARPLNTPWYTLHRIYSTYKSGKWGRIQNQMLSIPRKSSDLQVIPKKSTAVDDKTLTTKLYLQCSWLQRNYFSFITEESCKVSLLTWIKKEVS